MFVRALTIAFTFLLAFAAVGCEKTDHDSIDKWMRTEKGPGKLKKALSNEGIDADLSAHAAANMILMSKESEVYAALDAMSPGRRVQVVGALIPRLWNVARINDEKQLPTPNQTAAKDALFTIRKYADDAQKQKIDEYLIDWYAVISYEKRATAGIGGAKIIRTIGPAAGKKLSSILNQMIAMPGQEKVKIVISKQLLLGMAASGDPEAVKYILDLIPMDRGDKDLPKRAMDVLYIAFIDPGQEDFPLVGPEALVPNIEMLTAIAKDDRQPGKIVNDAVALIRATGQPHCYAPLLSMVGSPHNDERFKYVAAVNALICGGTKTIAEVVNALPETRPYIKEELQGSVVKQITGMTPAEKVKEQLRELLNSKDWVSRWTAIEALAAMKSTEDYPKIAAVASSKDKLVGYWGDNEEKKPDMTLGQRAKELANGPEEKKPAEAGSASK